MLSEILLKLGLNERESEDFIDAWSDSLDKSPYYFITFHGNDVINFYAPLVVRPKPQTVIRILMEYKPLKYYQEVPSFIYPQIPDRTGFTLVEWGGIER
ncbi:hypothetical protein A2V49_00720 [candidate division WWE3 bacterium RBG_19FT_COMBO_34_6]|uniref:Uncharacterized protein n=1 Tax=candidate division WWE3 bacterium RBG_19FT_COMBO_34_6 TaxID=1802612 RepID=A0A1F4UK96_UNCKA|nr:MAG: hypothetical protein A2V49_00720 [candidate division WWE3 bacterium RBG_19FT_COMBO_34_6]